MKAVGIIAEYNPFHSGHEYLIRKAKELTGADYTVVVMSPDFVQRGSIALADKYSRAEMALQGGADLVLELPVCFAASSAEFFAGGGVSLLSSLGAVDHLAFGCETGQPDLLEEAARFFSLKPEEEPEAYKRLLQEKLRSGLTYPAARAAAFAETASQNTDIPSALSLPNNILAVEYLKAILRQKSSLAPVFIRRSGQGYHDGEGPGYLSAETIRGILKKSAAPSPAAFPEQLLSPAALPKASAGLLEEDLRQNTLLFDSDLSDLMEFQLNELAAQELPEDLLTVYLDVTQDLANRIRNHIDEYEDFEQFVSLLKTRQMTETRIRRSLVHILLGITEKQMKGDFRKPLCARILGFRKSAGPLLHQIRLQSSLPLVAGLPDALKDAGSGREGSLSAPAAEMLLQTVRSSRIRSMVLRQKTGRRPLSEYRRRPVMI